MGPLDGVGGPFSSLGGAGLERKVYLVTYDLRLPATYPFLESRIKQYTWGQPLPNVWLVQTDEGRGSLQLSLEMATAPGDGLFIAELTRHFWCKGAQCKDETLAAWQKAAGG